MDRDHVFDGEEVGAAVALDRQMPGKPPRGRAGATERRVGRHARTRVLSARSGRGRPRRPRVSPATAVTDRTRCRPPQAPAVPRERIGQQQQQKIPEMQNATTATTMARRSLDSAGAPDDARDKGIKRHPRHRGIVHARNGDAEGGGRKISGGRPPRPVASHSAKPEAAMAIAMLAATKKRSCTM